MVEDFNHINTRLCGENIKPAHQNTHVQISQLASLLLVEALTGKHFESGMRKFLFYHFLYPVFFCGSGAQIMSAVVDYITFVASLRPLCEWNLL